MRSLVVDMVGGVGVCVCGVVCLVRVVGLEGVECVFVACEEGEWGEWVVGLGVLGVWGFGECWGKKLYYLVAPFKIADFRTE